LSQQPDHEDAVVGAAPEPALPPLRRARQPEQEPDTDHPVVSWAKAIAGGLKDTARQVMDEGRKGANEAYDEGWRRFDDKTRFRRRGRG
jgi:hypothetical protein